MTNSLFREQPNEPLATHLRVHRRRAGLTQNELAHLLGYKTYGVISRHEQLEIPPPLVAALGYQILFRVHVSEMFPGLTEIVEVTLETRLADFENYLGKQSAQGPRSPAIARKLEWLSERRSSGYK